MLIIHSWRERHIRAHTHRHTHVKIVTGKLIYHLFFFRILVSRHWVCLAPARQVCILGLYG